MGDSILEDNDLVLRRFHKFPEQVPGDFLVRQPFGVPLHGETKGMVGKLNRFDESIRRMTGNSKRGRDVFEALMVMAIYYDDWLAQHLRNAGAFLDLHFVHKRMP